MICNSITQKKKTTVNILLYFLLGLFLYIALSFFLIELGSYSFVSWFCASFIICENFPMK